MHAIDKMSRKELLKSAGAFAAGWTLMGLLRRLRPSEKPPRSEASRPDPRPRILPPTDSVKRHG